MIFTSAHNYIKIKVVVAFHVKFWLTIFLIIIKTVQEVYHI